MAACRAGRQEVGHERASPRLASHLPGSHVRPAQLGQVRRHVHRARVPAVAVPCHAAGCGGGLVLVLLHGRGRGGGRGRHGARGGRRGRARLRAAPDQACWAVLGQQGGHGAQGGRGGAGRRRVHERHGAGGAAAARGEVQGLQERVARGHVVLLPDEARVQARLNLLRAQERQLNLVKVLLRQQPLAHGLLGRAQHSQVLAGCHGRQLCARAAAQTVWVPQPAAHSCRERDARSRLTTSANALVMH